MHFPDSIVLTGTSVVRFGYCEPSFTGVFLPIDTIFAAVVAAAGISSASPNGLTPQADANVLTVLLNGLLETNGEPDVEIGAEHFRTADLVCGRIQHVEIAFKQQEGNCRAFEFGREDDSPFARDILLQLREALSRSPFSQQRAGGKQQQYTDQRDQDWSDSAAHTLEQAQSIRKVCHPGM
jgi:hypothetical protein